MYYLLNHSILNVSELKGVHQYFHQYNFIKNRLVLQMYSNYKKESKTNKRI